MPGPVHELEFAGSPILPRHLAHARAATKEVGLHLGPGNAVLGYRAAEAECLIRRSRLKREVHPGRHRFHRVAQPSCRLVEIGCHHERSPVACWWHRRGLRSRSRA